MFYFAVSIGIFANLFLQAQCQADVTLYEHNNYEGQQYRVSVPNGQCKNVYDFNDQATSLKTNKCIRLWEDEDCSGRKVDVQPSGIDNLSKLDFNDLLTSLSDCQFVNEMKDDVEIIINLNGANDLREEAEKAKKLMREWFPFIQNNLWSPFYKPVRTINIYYDEKDNGIYAAGREIHIPQQYVRNNKGDTGVWIHEMTHVIQQNRNCPGWVVEGFAEYFRRWFYEPKTTTKPTSEVMDNDYMGDWLLAYLNTALKRPLIYTIQKACHEGKWSDNFLRDLTGKDAKEWWKIMVRDNDFPFKRR